MPKRNLRLYTQDIFESIEAMQSVTEEISMKRFPHSSSPDKISVTGQYVETLCVLFEGYMRLPC